MSFLKNLFKKPKPMATITAPLSPEKIEELKIIFAKYRFQWIKSERLGEVCNFKDLKLDGDIVWLEFTDNTRINYSLVDEFCFKTEGDELLDIAPEKVKNSVNSIKIKEAPKATESPLKLLLKKQSPNPIDIDISLKLNIPSKELYNILCSSFDTAENEIMEYIVSGINIDDIKESIRTSIKHIYNDGRA